jgi:small-conductance mechanosensitive channel
VLRIISGIESYLLEHKDSADKDSVRLIARLIKILIIASIVLGVAQYFGFSISGLLTFGGCNRGLYFFIIGSPLMASNQPTGCISTVCGSQL